MASKELSTIRSEELIPFFKRTLGLVREDMEDNPYIAEALRVLPVGGYRSAIGSFWNAVVDDLRNKIIHRSLKLFNKSVTCSREIKVYEDFQDCVNDDQLIEGAFKIGVISWEASKVLRHAKETRHIFDGHPHSSEPSVIKVLAMMDDCIKYVLKAELPPQIVDIDEYLAIMATADYDRNPVAIENSLGDLPDIYKDTLIHQLFTAYHHPDASTVLRSNIELAAPILWNVLTKATKVQVVHRVDKVISKGHVASTEQAFAFVKLVKSTKYLSTTARKYKITPLVTALTSACDHFSQENTAVLALLPYGAHVPPELIPEYVRGLTHTYVGRIGYSAQYSRTDFYADVAANLIPDLFKKFDDTAAAAFVDTIRHSSLLRTRIKNPAKLRRLRSLGNMVLERISDTFPDREILEALTEEETEDEFNRLAKL